MLKLKALLILLALGSGSAQAGPHCTDGKTDSWIAAETMQQTIVDHGYRIKKFKSTSGGCYEIYGWDKNNRKVEVYFHPVSGAIVKQKLKD